MSHAIIQRDRQRGRRDDPAEHLAGPLPIAHHIALNADPVDIPIHDEFRAALPRVEVTEISRWDYYYDAAVIATGEARTYANLLLTIGARQAGQ